MLSGLMDKFQSQIMHKRGKHLILARCRSPFHHIEARGLNTKAIVLSVRSDMQLAKDTSPIISHQSKGIRYLLSSSLTATAIARLVIGPIERSPLAEQCTVAIDKTAKIMAGTAQQTGRRRPTDR